MGQFSEIKRASAYVPWPTPYDESALVEDEIRSGIPQVERQKFGRESQSFLRMQTKRRSNS